MNATIDQVIIAYHNEQPSLQDQIILLQHARNKDWQAIDSLDNQITMLTDIVKQLNERIAFLEQLCLTDQPL